MDALTLPDAKWRDRGGLTRLAEALGAREGEARFVGGSVRDTLLGLAVADIDVATTHEPEAVMARLRKAGIKPVPTGIDHGTITAVLASGPVEVTTLRRDVATDGRHASVAYTDDWRADAARRDFTMNALYADPLSGELFDYFGGLADLAARRVRFIGDPLERIAEDHLRILRFFRFLARFGDTPDAAGLTACTARANDLMALSRERIAAELRKLLVARSAVRVIRLMVEHGIFKPVLPEIGTGVERLARTAAREESAGIAPDPMRRLAALLPRDADTATSVGARLKLSKAERRRLTNGVQPIATEPHSSAYRIGTEFTIDRILNDDSADPAGAAALAGWSPPRLPISGGAVIARGIDAGPDVARLLREIEECWIAEGFPSDDRVAAIADRVVAQALRSTSKR